MARHLRAIHRARADRKPDPTATILDSRTLQSTPTNGGPAGDDGANRKRGEASSSAPTIQQSVG